MSQDSFATSDLKDDIQDVSRRALEGFLGNQALTQNLAPILDSVLGKYFRSSVVGVGGGATPFLRAGIAGPSDPAAGMYNRYTDSALKAAMASAVGDIQGQRDAFRASVQKTMFGGREPVFASVLPGMTNVISDLVFDSAMQSKQMQAGILEGLRYGGVLPTLGMEGAGLKAQQARSARVGRIANAFTSDDAGNYAGMRGQERGQLFAHAMMTGALSDFDGERDVQQIQERLQGMARTVQSLRSVFQGSVREVLAQLDGLSGADFTATMGGSGVQVARSLRGVGAVAGFSQGQVQMLAAGTRSVYDSIGATHSLGAAASTTLAASLLGAYRNMGPQQFINQQRFRENIMRRTVGAAESELSRQMSGAMSQMTPEQQAKFREELESGGPLNPERVAAAASRHLGRDVSAAQLTMLGSTDAAEVIRATGATTQAVLLSNMAKLEERQANTLRDVLRGTDFTDEQLAEITSGEMDTESVAKRIHEVTGIDRMDADILAGSFGRRMDATAKSMGLGNRQEYARAASLARNRGELNRITQANDAYSSIMGLLGTHSESGGFLGLMKMMEDGGDLTLGKALKDILGIDDVDEADLMKKLLGLGDNLESYAQASVLYDIVATGAHDGRQMGDDDVALAKKLLAKQAKGEKLSSEESKSLTELFDRAGAGRSLRQSRIIKQMVDTGREIDAEAMEEVNTRIHLEELAEKSDHRDGIHKVLAKMEDGSDFGEALKDLDGGTREAINKELDSKRLIESATQGGMEGILQAILAMLVKHLDRNTGA